AQWWGDVTVLMGESFYTFSPSHALLTRKGIRELVNWQRPDSTLHSPIPGNYNHELPAQMLASVGHYGFWHYYMNSADSATLAHAYPGVKKYLGVWKLDDTGLTEFRPGEWSWGDWGDNIDIRLLLAAWHYMALKGASAMAVELGMPQDTIEYSTSMKRIATAFNRCWTGTAYRHPQYHKDTDDRVQAMAILTGIAGPDKYDALKKTLHSKEHASPYMEKYVMEALFAIGDGRYAMDRMKRRFSTMVNDTECTTLFEGWEEGTYGGGSTNHAWSGGAITVIAQDVCGLRPTAPGWREFVIEPQFDIFGECAIEVPTVAGTIKSAYRHTENGISMHIEVPEGTTASLILPDGTKTLRPGSHDINF
ncbi:MAG: glycoside hydrolase, partial [Muribaculaceae bacterium]|nr:glycoside hydrolase [Muribaculaceae bacterium]